MYYNLLSGVALLQCVGVITNAYSLGVVHGMTLGPQLLCNPRAMIRTSQLCAITALFLPHLWQVPLGNHTLGKGVIYPWADYVFIASGIPRNFDRNSSQKMGYLPISSTTIL